MAFSSNNSCLSWTAPLTKYSFIFSLKKKKKTRSPLWIISSFKASLLALFQHWQRFKNARKFYSLEIFPPFFPLLLALLLLYALYRVFLHLTSSEFGLFPEHLWADLFTFWPLVSTGCLLELVFLVVRLKSKFLPWFHKICQFQLSNEAYYLRIGWNLRIITLRWKNINANKHPVCKQNYLCCPKFTCCDFNWLLCSSRFQSN